ncbi:DNA cytosine methyltransferase [Tenacibaculum maritimum]|uniref:DNA cytosine methyltransferase n=2 Tax=Tenacibaculum maritimum TaxID=107401 RepID=UPI0012E6ED8E|nr:DNA (cytosine-5-)-methyltransferase [Tenacibaculum maritimum]CAA0157186.1 Cytosine-specific methyltransferase [Tenacibaculum maritimum]CAA0239406.1 putative prophage cytosine-specific methyltransferase [Tenacibaculum maritimum]
MKILELFSGIGGFAKGFIDAGYEFDAHYFSEVDKYAIGTYQYNFKNAKFIGDVRNINGQEYKGIDIITFGSPCQDFSVAGKRKGLKGDRSALIREAMRIIKEAEPRVFIWENVKGTFSSNARQDFWAILQAFTDLGNYRIEWQLLNTRWFLPQNRERIYLVGTLRNRSKQRVFPFRKNDFLLNSSNGTKRRQSQAKDYSTTINPKFGSRASDTYLQVGDSDGFRVRKNGVAPTLRSKTGTSLSGNPIIKIKNATKKGFLYASMGDAINFSFLKSNTKRGRVCKGAAQTLDTSCSLVVLHKNNVIRRLTEIECERLQGFPDDWTKYEMLENEVKINSKTQRYKMLGNAVTVHVVKEVADRLKYFLYD